LSEPEYKLGEEFILSRSSHGRTEWDKDYAKIALKQMVRNIEKAIDEIELPEDHTNSAENLTLLENAIIYEILRKAEIGSLFKVLINNMRSYDELKRFDWYKPDAHLRLWVENQMLCRISTPAHRWLSDEEVRRKTWRFIETMRSNALGRWDYQASDLDNGNEIIIILPSLPYYHLDEDLREEYYGRKREKRNASIK